MPRLYELITGPPAVAVLRNLFRRADFSGGTLFPGLDWPLDRVAYRAHPGLGLKGALRSIVHWLVPYWSEGWRAKPLYTLIFFVFHVGLVLTPLFLLGHAVMFKERWGVNWPTLSMGLADVLTIAVMITAVCIAIRRLGLPEVRIVTTCYDFLLLLQRRPFCHRLSGGAPGPPLSPLAFFPHPERRAPAQRHSQHQAFPCGGLLPLPGPNRRRLRHQTRL